jgi:hypothetical protein
MMTLTFYLKKDMYIYLVLILVISDSKYKH